MNIELTHMRQFVAVADELHFGRAAIKLGMAQPPLSQAIKRLENRLGFELLERSRRNVALTRAGEVFLKEARATISKADAAVLLARQAASHELAELRVSFVSAALYRLLPAALHDFRARFPKVEVRLHEQPTDTQIESLIAGDNDLGFVHPPLKVTEDLTVKTISRDPLVAAVPAASDFAKLPALGLADLGNEPFILFPHVQGPDLHIRILDACRAAGFMPRISQEAGRMHTILSLVSAGMGVSLVPDGARSLQLDGVQFVPLKPPTELHLDLAMVWRRRHRLRHLSALIDCVENSTD